MKLSDLSTDKIRMFRSFCQIESANKVNSKRFHYCFQFKWHHNCTFDLIAYTYTPTDERSHECLKKNQPFMPKFLKYRVCEVVVTYAFVPENNSYYL